MSADDLVAELRAAIKAQGYPQLMTSEQVGEFLGVSQEYLFLARKERRGPPFLQMSSRMIRYDRDDVLAWARAHRIETCN